MINFRYHVVSLAAVFLALATGIVLGSTVIDQGFTKQLQNQANSLDRRLSALQRQNDNVTQQLGLWNSFAQTSLAPLMKGRLHGRTVMILSQDGSDPKLVDAVAQSVSDAGATLAGRIAFTAKWQLKDDTARQQLALAAGLADPAQNTLLQSAAVSLGARLGDALDPTSSGDELAALRDGGFLSLDPSGSGPFPPAGTLMIFVPAGVSGATPPQPDFFIPLLKRLAPDRLVAVAEPLSSQDSLVERVRSDASLRLEVATVDDADLALGRVALVAALRSLATGAGADHYGARRSATALVPASLVP